MDNPGCVVSWAQNLGKDRHFFSLAQLAWQPWETSSAWSRLLSASDPAPAFHLLAAGPAECAWWWGALGLIYSPCNSWGWVQGKQHLWETEPTGPQHGTAGADGEPSALSRRSTGHQSPALTLPWSGWPGSSSGRFYWVRDVWTCFWCLSSCRHGASLCHQVGADIAFHQPSQPGPQPATAGLFASWSVGTWQWEYPVALCLLRHTANQSSLTNPSSFPDPGGVRAFKLYQACNSSSCHDKPKAQAIGVVNRSDFKGARSQHVQLKKHSRTEAWKRSKTCTFMPLQDNIANDVVNILTSRK